MLLLAGVCISRSSGMLFQANRVVLWIMPVLQCVLLVFFAFDAVVHVWWNWWLLCLCFVAGLLGGAVYVNSFTLLTHEVEPHLREFSLSAACVADSFGIAAADITAIFIQGCLFKLQGLTGAAYKCEALGM
jgi:battenin